MVDIVIGSLALLDMIVELGHDRLCVHPAILGLVAGPGLLRHRHWSRRAARAFAWGLLVLAGLVVFLGLGPGRPGAHGGRPQQLVLAWGEGAALVAFCVATEVVMRHETIRALLSAGRGVRGWRPMARRRRAAAERKLP